MKTYIFVSRYCGNATVILSENTENEAWKTLEETVKDRDNFRLDSVEEEY